uniref:Uncharacterized protein n=1 Tax=Romanomermis culicivorax TaxID=13658 RepID=A0A915L756_ROMCU
MQPNDQSGRHNLLCSISSGMLGTKEQLYNRISYIALPNIAEVYPQIKDKLKLDQNHPATVHLLYYCKK